MVAIAPPPVGMEAEPFVQRDNAAALASLRARTAASRPSHHRHRSAFDLAGVVFAFGVVALVTRTLWSRLHET
jgi:hypothetical protein